MNTPICDFVKNYKDSEAVRLHMPGHKGKAFLGFEGLDITEIEGADVLYTAQGIIEESMANASSLFFSGKTLYSAEGSSLCIRAMVYLTAVFSKEKGEKPLILATRNAHKAFLSAVALNDVDVEWIYPEENEGLISLSLTAQKLRNALKSTGRKPTALYITSPDYLGNMADIKGLSEVCKEENLLFLVDNAHGAYLNFLEENLHPLHLGADMCCDSAHKTLPVLTGGAYLHISKSAPDFFKTQAMGALSLFASTSPSYLILQSLDRANKYLAEGYKERLSEFTKEVEALKSRLSQKGFELFGKEPLKITICSKNYGYKGTELAGVLKKNNIFCEYADDEFLVLMLTPENSQKDLNALKKVLLAIEKREEITSSQPKITKPQRGLGIREALFSPREVTPTSKAEGKILADYAISCPPAIPVAIAGEILDKTAIEALLFYGVDEVQTVK